MHKLLGVRVGSGPMGDQSSTPVWNNWTCCYCNHQDINYMTSRYTMYSHVYHNHNYGWLWFID